jgi:hypothetical protein
MLLKRTLEAMTGTDGGIKEVEEEEEEESADEWKLAEEHEKNFVPSFESLFGHHQTNPMPCPQPGSPTLQVHFHFIIPGFGSIWLYGAALWNLAASTRITKI